MLNITLYRDDSKQAKVLQVELEKYHKVDVVISTTVVDSPPYIKLCGMWFYGYEKIRRKFLDEAKTYTAKLAVTETNLEILEVGLKLLVDDLATPEWNVSKAVLLARIQDMRRDW